MEDARIVDLYWQRSEEAITQTQIKYGRYCSAIASNILNNEQDAEECVNDTYLAAWNSMPDQRPLRLSAYLGKITRNFALTRRKRIQAKKRGGDQTEAAFDELSECIPGPEDPEQIVLKQELSHRIEAFLRELPETEKLVFVSRYWYMAPVDEIAAKFGFSRAKTAGMLHRLRIRLRNTLAEEGSL